MIFFYFMLKLSFSIENKTKEKSLRNQSKNVKNSSDESEAISVFNKIVKKCK
jgi:hypothetical protein